MNNSNEKIWFNQQLMYFKDLNFGSNGVLDINLSNNTNDFKSFSPLVLNISVTSQSNNRKIYGISYCNSIDLISSFKEIMNNSNSIFNGAQKYEIIKKYYNDKILKFEFIKNKNTNEDIVIISIINDSSDYSTVIISYYTFLSIIGIVKSFANDFTSLNLNLINRIALTEILEQNRLIKNSIQVLPSTILEFYKVNSKSEVSLNSTELILEENKEEIQNSINIEPEENIEIKNKLEEFDSFLNDNLDKIDLNIGNIQEEKSEISKVVSSSRFIKHFASLENLENLMNSIVVSDYPHLSISSEFKNIGFDNLLPEINDDDFKSYIYLSSLLYRTILRQYTEVGTQIPQNFQVLKYQIKDPSKDNIELAYDLLAIFSYLKIFRSKIQERESDCFRNKSLFILTFRTFLDIYSFSFVESMNKGSLKNIILNRFKEINNFGFFESFNNILNLYNLDKINENEISQFLDALCEKIIGNEEFIKNYHDGLYSNAICRLNYKNNLNVEQIINYVIPLEVSEKLGIDITKKELLDKFIDSSKIPDDIMELFLTKQKKLNEVKKEEFKDSNILRYCKFNHDHIPKNIKDNFLTYIQDIGDNDFDFNHKDFIIEDIGEIILIALYEWNNSSNKKENYAKFNEKIETTTMNKDLIISKYKTKLNLENNVPFEVNIDF